MLLHQIIILAQLKFKLIDEDLNLLLGHLHAFLRLIPFFQQLLEELLGLELDDGCDFKEGHAGLGGSIAGGEGDDVFEGDAVGVEVEVGLVSEAGDVDYGAEVEMRV